MDVNQKDCCVVCNGTGKFGKNICTFCNGTGEPSLLAENHMRNHICQCQTLDRKFCPVCGKKCHHKSSQTDFQTIDSGHGGESSVVQYTVEQQEMIII